MEKGKTIKVDNIEDVPYISVNDGKLKVKGSATMTDSFWILVQRLNPDKSLDEIKGKLGVK